MARWGREGMKSLGRGDVVKSFLDDLTVGPLDDVDRGAATST
ncbi:hypothetical protein AKJ09_04954 [Labilithrix luteola]|uniref:Uncharacterized protein n=1 Tax=Labilithrix luteola TaxID=1391654 RepID=A0A0K1PXN9_9BACT|nr:hypothetical protein AKJ09_04954 [Labilithrix luteola]